MRRLRAACGLVAALAGLVTGCSAARGPAEAAPGAAGGRWNVLPAGDSGAAFAGAPVGELTQVVVAFPANFSGTPVRLRSVRLMNAQPGICLRGTVAYRVRGRPDLPGAGQAIVGSPGTWDPKYYGQPQLVTAARLPAHASTSWIVTIVFTVSAPGTYHLDRAKITYAAGGVSG